MLTLQMMTFKQLLLFAVSFLFSTGAIMNIGFSSFFWGIPFFLILAHLLLQLNRSGKLIALAVLPLIWVPFIHKENNRLYFPVIDSKLSLLESAWCATLFTDTEYYSLWPKETFNSSYNEDRYIKDKYCLEGANSFTIVGVHVSHADFGVNLWPIIQNDQSSKKYLLYEGYISGGLTEKTITSDSLKPSTQYQSHLTLYLGSLMYYPMLPIILYSAIKNAWLPENLIQSPN
ncbi:hypothetical protein PTW35_11085 [Photobacterium sp. DA100]|uniref:hypothetical protein n=1 Tax=Photobacterium sp. DA100 TaxID=3027472 RepID=UPI002478B947|nr:hypothetical protein [Photobacterium sp. DA100]WEM41185.1 hypothetical protein PTW35_11085 [Photobacterium sp. DA100]